MLSDFREEMEEEEVVRMEARGRAKGQLPTRMWYTGHCCPNLYFIILMSVAILDLLCKSETSKDGEVSCIASYKATIIL